MSEPIRRTAHCRSPHTACPAAIDQTFVINLDRRPDRWTSFTARLPSGFSGNLERFPAIDGRGLEPSHEIARLFHGNDFQYRRGVLGCALSHYRLWQRIADDDTLAHVLIFEDDVLFGADFCQAWSQCFPASLPTDHDLVYLGGWPLVDGEIEAFQGGDESVLPPPGAYIREQVNPLFGIPRRTNIGTFAYLVSRAGASKLCTIAQDHGFRRAVDYFLMDHWPELQVYATVPFLCWSGWEESSDIQNDRESLFGGEPGGEPA